VRSGLKKVFSLKCYHDYVTGAVRILLVLERQRGTVHVELVDAVREGGGERWTTNLYVSPDFEGEVAYIDVDGEGRHACELHTFSEGRVVKVLEPEGGYWEGECPVCRRAASW